jgi:hypothetical protein
MNEEQVLAVALLVKAMTPEEQLRVWQLVMTRELCETPGCTRKRAKWRRVCERCHKRQYRAKLRAA